ncbi:hypothetical protein KAM622c_51530 (plasmid) [Klebsiella quasipneumoniae subsp. quasipneumoniae]|nr:hypothetical protein KAM622c_51530 [Klebsiella quasipneumoniae subsp. quasipneumoniae]
MEEFHDSCIPMEQSSLLIENDSLLIYSPRLTELELEAFCEANIEHYRTFHEANLKQLLRGDRVPLTPFWAE